MCDTGIGIPRDKRDRLFAKFSQVDSSTTRTYGGTGLGLAISKQLAELMGGGIGVESEAGKGSEFWFTVRLAKPISHPLAASPTPADLAIRGKRIASSDANSTSDFSLRPGLSHARILVAEDNITNQQVAVGILGKLGVRAEVAANGAEVLKALETIPYDLVLMDVQMPEVDGLEATRRIRRPESAVLNHRVPVIAMTARAFQSDREECLQAGMDDYVTKPVEVTALVNALVKWLKPKGQDPAPIAGRAEEKGAVLAQDEAPRVFDDADLMRRMMNDRILMRVVVEGFLGDLPLQISRLEQSLAAGDAQAVAELAHRIKGASATVGGESLRAVAAIIEHEAKTGGLDAVGVRMIDLGTQFNALKAALRAFARLDEPVEPVKG